LAGQSKSFTTLRIISFFKQLNCCEKTKSPQEKEGIKMEPKIDTRYGLVEGIQEAGCQIFLGIPYARPPIGKLRFHPPEPPEKWDQVRPAKKFGTSSLQGSHHIIGFAAEGPVGEDCLYLNIFTPRADQKKRPVLFWIHGGGFTHGTGDSPIYNGRFLAERGDVVVVTINYRLGILGYLYLGNYGGKEWGASANCGQLDQIAALKWVRDNIEAFGGDPGNVTIFGESAGAAAVVTLMAMPSAKGLFQRAIAQSGTGLALTSEQAAGLTDIFLSELGLTPRDAGRLRDLPAEDLLKAQTGIMARLQNNFNLRFRPTTDELTLPRQPFEVIKEGGAGSISLMVGNNRDEMKLFKDHKNHKMLSNGELEKIIEGLRGKESKTTAQAIMDIYKKSRAKHDLPFDNRNIEDAVLSDCRFRIPGLRLAEVHDRAYVYLFTWESPALRGALGSCHALEMPFVFGTCNHPLEQRFVGAGPEADRLSQKMMDSWIAFARTGNPNHEGLNGWEPYDAKDRNTMVFNRESGVQKAPLEQERAAWE
jgi:para-nitrobenzyl esterase